MTKDEICPIISKKEVVNGMSSMRVSVKKHRSVFLYIILLLVVGYAISLLISMEVEKMNKTKELANIQKQYEEIVAENEQLEYYADDENLGAYMEQKARELNYAYPDEKIYYIVPSN